MRKEIQPTLRENKSGFTIVELLIVIVVIAVLAAISIVAFNGIQQRANNAKTLSAVTAYIKALNLYKVDNGQHPPIATSCLGNKYGASGCDSLGTYDVNGGNLNTTYLATYFNGSTPPMPAPNLGTLDGTGRQFGGAAYAWNSGSYGGANNGGIGLYYQGGTACPTVSGLTYVSVQVYSDGSGRWCRYSMD